MEEEREPRFKREDARVNINRIDNDVLVEGFNEDMHALSDKIEEVVMEVEEKGRKVGIFHWRGKGSVSGRKIVGVMFLQIAASEKDKSSAQEVLRGIRATCQEMLDDMVKEMFDGN